MSTKVKWIVGLEYTSGAGASSVWSRREVWAATEEEAARRVLGGNGGQQIGEGQWRRDFCIAHVGRAQ